MAQSQYFTAKDLLAPPMQRAAFSDRTAYVCAELARLAYFPFEGGSTLERLIDQVEKAMVIEGLESTTAGLIIDRLKDQLSQDKLDATRSQQLFSETLALGGFELVGTFNAVDTQGFVCRKNSANSAGTAFLVYRGTESIGDALSDVNAALTSDPFNDCEHDTSKVHSGIYNQFKESDAQVRSILDPLKDHQLIITGHSLGGGLAVLATRFYASNSSGACYTFGAPAVSNAAFQKNIKTPIYRIVNNADPVPRVPNETSGYVLQFVYYWVQKVLSLFGVNRSKMAVKLISDLKQYRQNGYSSYIMTKNNQHVLRTGSSLSFLDRFSFFVKKFKSIKSKGKSISSVGEDHKIDNYVKRLKLWAKNRNPC